MTPNWTNEEIDTLRKLRAEGKTAGEIAIAMGRSLVSVQAKSTRLGISCSVAKGGNRFVKAAADTTQIPVVTKPIELPKPAFGHLPLAVVNDGKWLGFGLVADTHLCCKEERLAELHTQYDLFAEEGIQSVFLAGNIVDGFIEKINGGSVFDSTIDGQCQYVIDNFPSRKGITTYFITGDDHEGWWQKSGFNFGGYLQFLAKDQGRDDLQYIGHIEADVEVNTGAPRPLIIKVQHPGGGSAYSRSYTGQKQVEAFEGGEKPDVLVQGHYHVSNYMNDRNIHVIGLPGFQDQTIFARKKRLRMEVGGAILRVKIDPATGATTRCQVEFNRYFTRGYYKPYLRSDVKILKGHLVLQP